MAGRTPALPPLLASRSPRRAALLATAGIAFEPGPPPDVDETPPPGLSPAEVAEHLARAKATAVARRAPGRVVLAADTVVALEGRLFGKPADAAEATALLAGLQGREHQVFTGVAVARDGDLVSEVASACVRVARLTAEEIAAYVATGEPLDKAGGYAIQGRGGRFVRLLDGGVDTVVGLPLAVVRRLLQRMHPDSR